MKYLEYTLDASKNNQGGINDHKYDKKVVRTYQNKVNLDRCVVKLYLEYMSHSPTDPKFADYFYLRPLAVPRGNVWYSCQPIGRQKLGTIVADMASRIGLKGRITNHSLRATAASRMYQSNIDEQLVMERTGYHSNCVGSYKRTSSAQLQNVSEVLCGNATSAPSVFEPMVKKPCVENVQKVEVKNDQNHANNVCLSNVGDKPLSLNFTVNITK